MLAPIVDAIVIVDTLSFSTSIKSVRKFKRSSVAIQYRATQRAQYRLLRAHAASLRRRRPDRTGETSADEERLADEQPAPEALKANVWMVRRMKMLMRSGMQYEQAKAQAAMEKELRFGASAACGSVSTGARER